MSKLFHSDICPICRGKSDAYDVVDLNRASHGNVYPLSGIAVYYFRCENCEFIYAPMFRDWGKEKFTELIYNDDYGKIDGDMYSTRPTHNASILKSLFDSNKHNIRHLDYGGGNGLLSKVLSNDGWLSSSWDPFQEAQQEAPVPGTYNLITAFEVFEHASDVRKLMDDLNILMSNKSMVMLSTMLSDGQVKEGKQLNWWYACPRNGHISLFSRKSISKLAADYGFNFASFSDNLFHVLYKDIPDFAIPLFKKS